MIKVFVVMINKGLEQEVDSVHRFRNSANSRKIELPESVTVHLQTGPLLVRRKK